jgi:hypothetical protein
MDLPERGIVSEDLSFCIRHRNAGGKVWAAIGHKISHVGPYDFAARYLDVVEQQANQVQMEAVKPMSDAEIALLPAAE